MSVESPPRARSESPYARGLMVNLEDFPSSRRRAASCGYNSDSDLMTSMTERGQGQQGQERLPLRARLLAKSAARQNLSTTHLDRAEVYRSQHAQQLQVQHLQQQLQQQQQQHQQQLQLQQQQLRANVQVREVGVNTDKLPEPPPQPRRPPSPPQTPRVRTRDRSVNTDPPPRSPPPPRDDGF